MAEAKQKEESCLLALFWLQTGPQGGKLGSSRKIRAQKMGEKGLLIQGEGTDRLFDCGLLGERRCPTIKAFVGKGEKTSWEPRRDRLGSAAARLLKSLKPRTSSTGRVFFTGERKEITQLSFCCNKKLFQSLQSLLVLVGKHP